MSIDTRYIDWVNYKEEELGITLYELLLAIECGFFYKTKDGSIIYCQNPVFRIDKAKCISKKKNIYVHRKSKYFFSVGGNRVIYTKDYGKTWSNNKYELE